MSDQAARTAQARFPFSVLIKPRGAICNLDCQYCFFLSKEALYPGSDFRMSDEVLDEFTRQYIAAQPGPEVTFGWQGGEPTLMGLAFFQRAVELQAKYRRPGQRITNTLQTNGTLLDDDWCRFLHEHGFLVGLSLDGPRALHDAYRQDKAGRPTFDRVLAGLEKLRTQRVDFNILATVNAANAEHPLEVYRFFRDEAGAQFVQFIPIVEPADAAERAGGAVTTGRSVSGEAYGRFLNAIFDEWVRNDVGRIFVQAFDAALAAWLGAPASVCVYAETCGAALALEHNGDLYACDHFVDPEHCLGNIRERSLVEMVEAGAQTQFGLAKRDALPRTCRACPVRFACHGGCPKDRLLTSPEGEPGLNALCAGYRAFFAHVDGPMRAMAAELRAGRPAANIMLQLAAEEAAQQQRFQTAARNAPCPCGSGLKFKHCHGRH